MRHSEIFGALIEDALASGSAVRFQAEGVSMYPTIRDGETITVVAASADEVGGGDILLCRHGQRLLAHRVIAVATSGGGRVYELRGDAKASSDALVGASDVVGKVIDVRRNGRRIPLCGRAARLRRTARLAASRARALMAVKAAVVLAVGRRLTANGPFALDSLRVSWRPRSRPKTPRHAPSVPWNR
ncbi:MAG: S24/S26 family peptidase [Vicinamibacterales bacterium]